MVARKKVAHASWFRRNFMTVTPFSKLLALLLFITLPFLMFVLGLTLGISLH